MKVKIYKLKDGRWVGKYIIGNSDKYHYCYGISYDDVRGKLIKKKVIQDTNTENDPTNVKFSTYCQEFLNSSRRRIKDSTYAKYYLLIDKYICKELGDYKVNEITRSILYQFEEDLVNIKLSSKYIKDIIILTNSIMRFINSKYDYYIPPYTIRLPKNNVKTIRTLSSEEQNKLINYLTTDVDSYKLSILLIIYTGLRVGEVCGLKWSNVSLINETISIEHTVQRIKNFDAESVSKTKIEILTPKSSSSFRVIPITGSILKLLKDNYIDNPKYFITSNSEKVVEPRVLQRKFKKYCEDCNLQNIHLHTLRHNFATRAVEKQVDIKSLSEILGHSNVTITLNTYTHPSLESKRKNMIKMFE